MKKLDIATFQAIVLSVPLVSVDLLLVRRGTEALLGLRANRPAQACWFVPGGRIYKNEPIRAALVRVADQELGLGAALISRQLNSQFLGVFEQFYSDCFSGEEGITTHYVSMVHILAVQEDFALPTSDEQHLMLRWWPISEAIASPDVHQYCKDYLLKFTSN